MISLSAPPGSRPIQQATPNKFGTAKTPYEPKADDDILRRTNGPIAALAIITALGGKYITPGWLQEKLFPASPELYMENRRLMEARGARITFLEPRPGFPMTVGHIPAQNGRHTAVITLGANDDIANVIPLVDAFRAQGFGVVFYKKALLFNDGKTGKHLGKQNLSFLEFEENLISDVDYLSEQMAQGALGQPIPFDEQLHVGHSVGADLVAKMIALSGRDYPLPVLLGPIFDFSDAIQRVWDTEIPKWLKKWISPQHLQEQVKGFCSLSAIPPGSLPPSLVMVGKADALQDARRWLDQGDHPNLILVEMPWVTHSSIIGRHGDDPSPSRRPRIKVNTLPEAFQPDPAVRVVSTVKEVLEDPEAYAGSQMTRFAGQHRFVSKA